MRSIGLIGSLAVLALSAPLAAQSNKFRTDDPRSSAGIPTTVQNQQNQLNRRGDKIPPGQLPPAGMCRIWIDGVPPGQQPAPTDCQTAVANKPANARILWGDQTAFPGKGKSKSKNAREGHGNSATDVRGQRGRGGDDDEGDDDADDRDGNRARGRSTQLPSTIGGVIPSQLRSEKSRKGKGHGDD